MIHTHPSIKEQEDHIYFQCAHGSGLARCRHLSSINIIHNSQGRPTLKGDAALLRLGALACCKCRKHLWPKQPLQRWFD
ncbi:MAG: hypothetical protein ACPIOQ_30030 [Promethearchaeia archaeon]